VLDLLEGLLDLGELDVAPPQGIGLMRGEVSAQQVAGPAVANTTRANELVCDYSTRNVIVEALPTDIAKRPTPVPTA
jgi:hypothetical protein